jgi:hypothetical protein
MGGAVSAMKKVTMYEIPIYSDKTPRWEMSVDLSGKRYQFNIAWNTRMACWIMAISDTSGNLLIGGIRLVLGCSLLDKYRAFVPDLPPGDLMLLDRENKMETAELNRDNFATRFAFTYSTLEGE